MQLICISRGSYSGGKEFAERLAKKLGWSCLSREELLDEAAGRGIAVGKLEMAMIKPRPLTERMALERDHYQAFVTSVLCERTLKENLVYHGRTAHLLLPSVGHILRIRVVSDMEYRIEAVMQRLNLSREKAKASV
ncbi:MAG: cytidylate kinase-like family protein, partial [bacterium]